MDWKYIPEVKRKLKMCIFASHIENKQETTNKQTSNKKPHPKHHRIYIIAIMEKAWTGLSTSYKQPHSSEGQLWNLMTTAPVYHSTSDHIRRTIWVWFIHSSFLKSFEKNLLSRNKTLRFKAVTTLKMLLLIFAGLYPRNQEEKKKKIWGFR